MKKSRSIQKTLNYHELKLQRGIASRLIAENFPKEINELSTDEVLYYFRRRNSLNQKAEHESMNFILTFHPAELIPENKMKLLAKDFMELRGLGDQPYLVYRHQDTSQPHMHILTPPIQPNGLAIPTDLKWLRQIKQISDELATKHSLMTREQTLQSAQSRDRVIAHRIKYGAEPTTAVVSSVLARVVGEYSVSSLEEFNAVLQLYNLQAYRGKEQSHLYKHGGLIYRVLHENGKPTGTKINASFFDTKATLKDLEEKFKTCQESRQRQDQRITTTIDWVLRKNNLNFEEFKKALKAERITVYTRQDKNAFGQELFFIDHDQKAAYQGKVLGQKYSWDGIQARCISEDASQAQKLQQTQKHSHRHRQFPSF
jgi:hypothetical protein